MTNVFVKFVIFLMFFLQSQKGICQWQTIYQDSNIYNMGVHFLNADTGFVVGVTWNSTFVQEGIIFRTTNGGVSWDSVFTNSGNFMIEFPSEAIGYTGGHDGSVMKTTDMGDSWTIMPSWCCNDYSNGYFFNNDTGIVVLWGGEIYKTMNGSNSWAYDTSIGGDSPFPGTGSIQFLDDTVGIIAAGFNGIYSRTIDGGANWQSGTIDSAMFLNAIYMKNYLEGYAVGYNGKYSRTFDGGATWSAPVSLCAYTLHDMTFFNDSIGYIVGGNEPSMSTIGIPNGVILRTQNGGNSWTVIDSSYFGYLTSIQAVNDSVGYAAGGEGLILKITNANILSSIETHHEEMQLNIFPNPVQDELTVYSSNSNNNVELKILNLLGEEISRGIFNLPAKLNLKSLKNGFYFIQMIDENGAILSRKFIKQY